MKEKIKKIGKVRLSAAITICAAAVVTGILLVTNIFFPLKYFTAWVVAGNDRILGELCFRMLDVGEADCSIVAFPDGKSMLIDGGDGTYANNLKILTELNRMKIDKIDYLVCTSVSEEHCGGLADIVEVKDVGVIYAPFVNNTYITESYGRFCAAAENCGAEWRVGESGGGEECGEAFFTFLSPAVHSAPGGAYEELNGGNASQADIDAASAVMWIEYNKMGIFCAGDAPSYVLDRIASEYNLTADKGGAFGFEGRDINFDDCKIYKAAGHGAEGYTSALLADMLSPEISLISSGKEGGLSAGGLSDLSAYGSIYITAYNGDVTIKISHELNVECAVQS